MSSGGSSDSFSSDEPSSDHSSDPSYNPETVTNTVPSMHAPVSDGLIPPFVPRSSIQNAVGASSAVRGDEHAVQHDADDDDMENPHADVASSANKNCKYTYISRSHAKPKGQPRSQKWMVGLSSMTEPKLRRTVCCKKLKCFTKVDYDYYMERSHHLFSISLSTRGGPLR